MISSEGHQPDVFASVPPNCVHLCPNSFVVQKQYQHNLTLSSNTSNTLISENYPTPKHPLTYHPPISHMHFYLPPWLYHGRPTNPTAIFSLDLQPNGMRLATAGQDAHVKIWHIPTIQQYSRPTGHPAKPSPNAPPTGALLASISSHSSAVNSVRWSPTSNLLASGGDDAVVLVYELSKGPPGLGKAEDWRVRKPLRAHESDVTDVSWSPDSVRLASASVDNTIYVWHIPTERPLHRLHGHKGLVKGVAWDPVGRFLASQSDDKTVRIWRTSDWKTELVLSKPFQDAVYKENSMAFFLRLSWSPCGTQLLATNAYRSPGAHHAPMFSRVTGFEEQVEFVGHREPVVSTRFSPRLYRPHPNNIEKMKRAIDDENNKNQAVDGYVKKSPPDEQAVYTCLALGSKDCGATVWQASGVRPFFDMTQMFDMDVIDLSWGTDGYTLCACSTDGRVMYIRFEPEELGLVVSPAETRTILTKQWRLFGGAGQSKPLPESADQLMMERDRSRDAQVENIDFVDETLDTEDNRPPTNPDAKSLPQQVLAAAAAVRENGPTPPADPRIIARQAETRVRGGKRRITPMAVTTIGATSAVGTTPTPQMEISETLPAPTKRPRTNPLQEPETSRGSFAQARQANGIHVRSNGTPHQQPSFIPPGAKPVSHAAHLYAPSVYGLCLMLLPEKKGVGPGRCRVISTDIPPTVLESKEFHGSGGGYVITCSRGGEVQWRDFHAKSAPVTALAGAAGKFAAAGTGDAMLFLYSANSGRRLTPPIGVDSAPYILEAIVVERENAKELLEEERECWFAVFVSRSALCSVFDVKRKKLICARSAVSLLARPVNVEGENQTDGNISAKAAFYREISYCRVTEFGEPILILSDGHVFAYSRDYCSWLRVVDDSCPNSEYMRTIPTMKQVGILRSLHGGTGVKQKALPSLSGMGDLRRSAVESLAHLESLMESAITLGSAIDFRYYLTNYAARIAAAVSDDVENCVVRLRELCDKLLNSAQPDKDVKILGMSSRELLEKTILPVVSANRQMQRFVDEYTECLKDVARLASPTN